MMAHERKRQDPVATGLFLAGLFLGLGIGGGLYENWAAGALIGLAAGFLLSAVSIILRKKR